LFGGGEKNRDATTALEIKGKFGLAKRKEKRAEAFTAQKKENAAEQGLRISVERMGGTREATLTRLEEEVGKGSGETREPAGRRGIKNKKGHPQKKNTPTRKKSPKPSRTVRCRVRLDEMGKTSRYFIRLSRR